MQPKQFLDAAPPTARAGLRIRPAQPGDQEPLTRIAAQTWDGNDYLPRVFESWLNDPLGGFFVATLRDQVVGVAKVTRLAENEWWLEGLRVDPAYHGLGFARILHHFTLNQVHQHGAGVVRFSTGSMNEAVQRLAAESGFERVAVYAPYGADMLDGPVTSWRLLGPGDHARVWALLGASAHFEQAQRSFEREWSFYRLTIDRLVDHLAAGLVYGWQTSGDLAGVVIVNPAGDERWPGDPVLQVAYLDVPVDQLTVAARDLRRLAAALDRMRVRLKLLHRPERIAALEAAEYAREWEGDVYLYAREVHLAARADVRTETLPPVGNG
jgi:RimJ/RimL family protein N-acetyltransferase